MDHCVDKFSHLLFSKFLRAIDLACKAASSCSAARRDFAAASSSGVAVGELCIAAAVAAAAPTSGSTPKPPGRCQDSVPSWEGGTMASAVATAASEGGIIAPTCPGEYVYII